MKKDTDSGATIMKREIGKGATITVVAVFVVAVCWFGWNSMETPENRGLNEEAIYRAAEAKAKSNHVDLRTLPVWSALYYKYHPEEKPPSAAASPAAPAADAPGPGAVLAAPPGGSGAPGGR